MYRKKAHDLSLVVDVRYGEDVPLKRSLAERLGRVVDEELIPPQKGEYQKDHLQSFTPR